MTPEEQRDLEELEHEFRRVGITWHAFAEVDRLNAPNEPPSPDGSFAMELNYPKTTAFLRTLPDGAGEAAFIAAWFKQTESVRKRAEAAMRAEECKRRGPHPGPGASGA
jgi:hypothetical protein